MVSKPHIMLQKNTALSIIKQQIPQDRRKQEG